MGLIIRDLGLEHARTLASPGIAGGNEDVKAREVSPDLESSEATEYRAIAARLNYLSLDRPDIQYAAKNVARFMSAPKQYDWKALKRVGRYLRGAGRFVQQFEWQDIPETITAYTDSDWAGDKVGRKSTSGGVIKWGCHTIKSWSSTQQVVALSSGEAELYALLKGAAQAKGVMSMFMDWSYENACIVRTDANAALGIVHRLGLGKTRHIDIQYLWIQQEVANKNLRVDKVSTHDNPADLLTKFLKAETMEKHIEAMRCRVNNTRAETALKINEMTVYDEWKEKGETWLRTHAKPRKTMFTPLKVPGGPSTSHDVGAWRVTIGKYDDGENFKIIDNWITSKTPHKNLGRFWTGTTSFTWDDCT